MEVYDFLEAPLQSISLSGGWFTLLIMTSILDAYLKNETIDQEVQAWYHQFEFSNYMNP